MGDRVMPGIFSFKTGTEWRRLTKVEAEGEIYFSPFLRCCIWQIIFVVGCCFRPPLLSQEEKIED